MNKPRHRKFTKCIYSLRSNTIYFSSKINAYSILQFSSAIDYFKRLKKVSLNIDFVSVTKVFPNGMLPIICSVDDLRESGINVFIRLPSHDETRRIFRSVNWAHFLAPEQYQKSESTYDRHLVTRRFINAEEQLKAVNDFMDVVLRTISIPKDIISALEWSINEITDNVLNHSNSKNGGIIQASTHYKENKIVFAVADGGRGILKSMQEGFPNLRNELDAIGEAIKAGVTRNPKFGQGNGLAGTLRITTMTGGSLEIFSGNGRLIATKDTTVRKPLGGAQFKGVLISGEINIVENFSISEALNFNNQPSTFLDIVDLLYEMEDSDCLMLIMKEEATGFGSRKSGLQIKTKLINLLRAKPNYPIIINWDGVPVISSSFADELIGKLFLELGAMTFSFLVKNRNMEPLIQNLLDKAVAQRLTQETD